jgi:hypothetical protein
MGNRFPLAPRFWIALITGTLALGILPIAPRQDQASAVSRIPIVDIVEDRGVEQRYLTRVIELLHGAIANRVKMDFALRTRRPAEEYQRLLDEFRMRQLGFLLHLQELQPPPRLIRFHEGLRSAVVTQTSCYAAFVSAKMRDPNVNLDWMTGHPTLRATGDAIQAAFDHLRRLHPALDQHTEAALEGQLSWLDAI